MHAIWHWVLWLLTWASSDPASIDAERARAAGCVSVAYATFATEPKPPAKPACPDGKCPPKR